MKRMIHALFIVIFAAALGPSQAATPAAPKKRPEVSKEKKLLEKLTDENRISEAKRTRRLQTLIDEREEAKVRYDLLLTKQKIDMAALETRLKKLTAENGVYKLKVAAEMRAILQEKDLLLVGNLVQLEKNKAALAAFEDEKKKLMLQSAIAEEKHKQALALIRREKETLEHRNALQRAKLQAMELRSQEEKNKIDLEGKRLGLKSMKLKLRADMLESRLAKLRTDLKARSQKEAWKKEANKEPDYVAQPFDRKNRRLIISDRRIPLNGPIFAGVADFVTDRIHYYNNLSADRPIFIVIDRCPGGSVMEGYRIVKAIEASKAPVHVVVKSFAASMAAVITTMADHSYAYPNAIILHHQMSTMQWGNMTQLKEQLAIAKKWEARLHAPVAKKIGMSLEKFRKKMYEHNSDGDWEEFGDDARKLKWVDEIVEEIRETGYVKNPDSVQKKKTFFALKEKVDEKGRVYVNLPRLAPFDLYHIYNPDRYYR